MTDLSQRTFRAVALQRAASPEQLDHLVRITRPFDWMLVFAICIALIAAVTWGIVGRVPTRAEGQGILISGGGRVVEASSAASGRLATISVMVGDRVTQGQPIAEIVQTDIQQRHQAAVEVFREKERQHADLIDKTKRELASKAQNFAKLEAAFNQVIKATTQRIDYLTNDVKTLEDLMAKGLTTRRTLEERRRDLNDAQQRKEDTFNEILKIRTTQTDLETQRERESQTSEFALNDARRQMESAAGLLTQNTQIISPVDGRVLEIKVSAGAVLAVGAPVVAIESEGQKLEALIYIPAERGKNVKLGMPVRIEPSTVKREEFGTMVGTVVTISDFPMTPQGMAAVLHNDNLVTRFSKEGAAYAATVSLEQDPETVSGYRWAVGQGPPIRLSSGTLTRAEITTRRQRPLDLVVPLIRRLTGIDG
ncbi:MULTISPECIES: NHLP bacteriocin system secretion protein [unclassified Bradyrhizobium]|uniref:NHLP bacteriocin system secretion protein n=1 Tax=unclassified Bradyrhizobium TaxID=2631580 RepID=UPI001BAB61E7|nr:MULTISPECIES: NHLP bacteriocin system secretion protein [unclassified Bradyrhizobium]MBR1229012.1 NHLP bacteriocin system secretion protein [Bradyrhizobium sp. AUGA SZCCT0176]MBR1235350.1 NHLP bacteriocin system secretion protein [Bradyrhizobium sp. AUGA SZCCT0182]MBR1282197.1 NHLP bacteriocin system secretion protein [Bradyrhizobium sp. AUGA SZCCT0177]MBR1299053.1 NHLP bacteriocin system secretion protein [Bradyrhizobium sp. AUGA SZCCT0042]